MVSSQGQKITTMASTSAKVMNCRVCQVFSPGEFYLQEKEKDPQLTELLERLDEVYYEDSEDLRLPGSLIREGQLCVVMWPVDNHWYRATIVEAQDSHTFKLEYYDYGTVCLHTRAELHLLLPDLQPDKYPKMSQKARLDGVKPADSLRWGREASDAFQKLVGGGIVGRDVDVTTTLVSRQADSSDRWSVILEVKGEEEEEDGGKMVDVGQKLASLGLVLLEFKEVKPAHKLDRNSDLLPLLERLPGILKQKKVNVEPSFLEEINVEYQAISDLLNSGDLSQVGQRQRALAQRLLGVVMSQVLTLEDSQEKREILSSLGEEKPPSPSS